MSYNTIFYNAMSILINPDGEYFLEVPIFERDGVTRAKLGPIEASCLGEVLTDIMTADKDALIKYELKNKLERIKKLASEDKDSSKVILDSADKDT